MLAYYVISEELKEKAHVAYNNCYKASRSKGISHRESKRLAAKTWHRLVKREQAEIIRQQYAEGYTLKMLQFRFSTFTKRQIVDILNSK